MGVRKKNITIVSAKTLPGSPVEITKNKPADDEFKNNEALLKTTLDSSFNYIQVLKAVRDKRGKIIDFMWVLNNRKLIEKARR
jgi:hypothetical protein